MSPRGRGSGSPFPASCPSSAAPHHPGSYHPGDLGVSLEGLGLALNQMGQCKRMLRSCTLFSDGRSEAPRGRVGAAGASEPLLSAHTPSPPPGPGLSPLPVPCVPGGLTPSEPQGQAGVEGAGGHGPAGSRAWGLPRVRRGPETSGEEEGKAEGESGRETPRRHLWVEQQGL